MTGTTGATGSATSTFVVKSRKTLPIVLTTVTATSREEAIAQLVKTAAEGEEIEVMDAKEDISGTAGGPTGATGVTGASGPTGSW
jgi:hypothetical protein